jgi:hypothetical protein
MIWFVWLAVLFTILAVLFSPPKAREDPGETLAVSRVCPCCRLPFKVGDPGRWNGSVLMCAHCLEVWRRPPAGVDPGNLVAIGDVVRKQIGLPPIRGFEP